MTITISNPEESSKAIQQRLHAKYAVSGEWANMSVDEKEDAAILEKMLYLEEAGQAEPLSHEENTDFSNEMKSWL